MRSLALAVAVGVAAIVVAASGVRAEPPWTQVHLSRNGQQITRVTRGQYEDVRIRFILYPRANAALVGPVSYWLKQTHAWATYWQRPMLMEWPPLEDVYPTGAFVLTPQWPDDASLELWACDEGVCAAAGSTTAGDAFTPEPQCCVSSDALYTSTGGGDSASHSGRAGRVVLWLLVAAAGVAVAIVLVAAVWRGCRGRCKFRRSAQIAYVSAAPAADVAAAEGDTAGLTGAAPDSAVDFAADMEMAAAGPCDNRVRASSASASASPYAVARKVDLPGGGGGGGGSRFEQSDGGFVPL